MEKILKLYTSNETPFPSSEEQVVITSFTYNAKRMGDAPSISFSFMHSLCLDDSWSHDVYTQFNGEKYFLKQKPSSSFDNTDCRYKHTVEMISERVELSGVYFFDVVLSGNENDKPRSNTSKVVFFGDIKETASRLNESLKHSGLDYRVIIDSNIESEEKLVSINDKFISDALKDIYNIYKIPYYYIGKEVHFGYYQGEVGETFEYGADKSLMSISRNNSNHRIINRCTGIGSEDNIPYYYPNPTPYGEVDALYNGVKNLNISVFDWGKFAKCGLNGILKYSKVYYGGDIDKSYTLNDFTEHEVILLSTILDQRLYGWVGQMPFYISSPYSRVTLEMSNSFGDGFSKFEIRDKNDIALWWGTSFDNDLTLPVGNYTAYVTFGVGTDAYEAETTARTYGHITFNIKKEPIEKDGWTLDGKIVNLSNLGIRYAGSPSNGDEVSFILVRDRVAPSPNLMPSIYRESYGAERFYNALNDSYKDENGVYYTFANPYAKHNRNEHIEEFADIKPTIANVINADGNRVDSFIDFAYDDNDNDEVDDEGKYLHPYFYAKLRRFDGSNALNIFAHAIESAPMTISMKSGACGACKWEIGVDDSTKLNPVQVDDDGNLLRNTAGEVIRTGVPQEKQNDTINHEVWIALKKEYNTFGVIMPNSENKYKPSVGDNFVILNISLPQSYIESAERRLTDAIIKYMYENNSDKFDFLIKLSRIYMQEHPYVMNTLNENSAVNVRYNNKTVKLGVSSYSYKIDSAQPLPEVTIELSEDFGGKDSVILRAISEVKEHSATFEGEVKKQTTSIQQNKANKATTLSGYGITDAYTKAASDSTFIGTRSNQSVSGVKDFSNGLKVGGKFITYDAEKNVFILTANLLVEGGVAWNSSIEGFEPKTITDAVMIDSSTLGINENGEIYVKGSAGGGGSIAYPLSWSGYSQGMWDGSASANITIPSLLSQLTNDVKFITSADLPSFSLRASSSPIGKIYLCKNGVDESDATLLLPTKLSQFTNDSDFITSAGVNSLLTDYLPKSGGSVNGNISATTFLPTGDIAIQLPDGEYIDRWGNIVLPSTAGQWSVKNRDMTLLSVRNDGEIRVNNTIHFTSEGTMLQMQGDMWKQARVLWHDWNTTEWDSLSIQLPSWDMNNIYFKLRLYEPAVLNTSLQVNGNITATGEITQHSSLELKDVVDTRFLTLKELAELKPYSFYWKDGRDDKLHAGAVADYVMSILPEVISTDKDDIHSMNYANAAWVVSTSLTPYVSLLVEEMESLKAMVEYLKDKLNER